MELDIISASLCIRGCLGSPEDYQKLGSNGRTLRARAVRIENLVYFYEPLVSAATCSVSVPPEGLWTIRFFWKTASRAVSVFSGMPLNCTTRH